MRSINTLVANLAITMLVAFSFSQQAFAQQASAKTFGELPLIADAEISPDGKTIAMLQSTNDNSYIVFYDMDNELDPVAIQLGESRVRDLFWGNNERLILLASNTISVNTTSGVKIYEFKRYFTLGRFDGSMTRLMNSSEGFENVIGAGSFLHTLPDDDQKVLMANYDTSWRPGQNDRAGQRVGNNAGSGGYNLYKVDLYSGREKTVRRGSPSTRDWVVDRDGNVVARVDLDPATDERRIFAKLPDSNRFKKVASYKQPPGRGTLFTFVGASADPMRPIVRSYHDSDKLGLFEYDLEKGEISTPLFNNNTYDLDSTIYDTTAATVIGARYIDDFVRDQYFDAARRSNVVSLGAALSAATVSVTSESADRNLAVVRADYNDRPSAYYLFDKPAGSLEPLGSTYPPNAARSGIRSRYDFSASDGLSIPGYLTKPQGLGASNLPLIVLPHGGPEGRDDMSFYYWANFYAARGYAVYQPNFRGSDGYGFSYRQAGFGEWGRKMQSDITEGVQKLIADGVVDPNRICIVGASYGGYAALAGATLTPDIYACAVSVNGVADLIHMLSEEKQTGEYSLAYWERRIGDLGSERNEIRSVSPVHNVENIQAPVLLIHSKDDTVVPISNSWRMRDAMKEAGKKVTYYELDGEDHWLSSGKTRTAMLEQSIKFIDRYIGR